MDSDSTVEKLIGCGRYQAWHFILFQWITILQACNIAFMVFGKYSPKLDCDSGCLPRNFILNGETSGLGIFGMYMENISDNEQSLDDLSRCKNSSVPATQTVQFYSIAIEWRLFCSKEKLSYVILTTQMLGILIGSLVFGQLSDFYGRRKVLFVALVCQLACGASSSFSRGWKMFMVFRALLGFFGGGTHTTNQVLFAEVVNAKHRLWLSNVGGWPLGVGFFVIIAWLTKEWRSLSLYSNIVCIPTLFLLWKLDESPRWRLQHGQYSKAESTLRKFMHLQSQDSKSSQDDLRTLTKTISTLKRSNASYDSSPDTSSDEGRDQAKWQERTVRYTYWNLLNSTSMRRYALVVALTHFASSCIAHGIMFHADALSGDIYVNLFLLSTFRWIMNICTIIADAFFKCGRKHIYVIPCLAIAVCSSIIVIRAGDLAGSKTVTALTLTAGALSSPLWISTLLWPAELFPTPVRNLASSFGAVFDRFGGVMIPQILLLARVWPSAPYAVFALLALLAATAVMFVLPETKGRPLPERMPSRNGANSWEHDSLVKELSDEGNASPA